jgi:hypothetical protein
MPDLDLEMADGATTVFALLQSAKPVLLDFDLPAAPDISPWADRVTAVRARFAGRWNLPVLGEIPSAAAVLIRPDGHVAWVGKGTERGLRDALAVWFGPGAGA